MNGENNRIFYIKKPCQSCDCKIRFYMDSVVGSESSYHVGGPLLWMSSKEYPLRISIYRTGSFGDMVMSQSVIFQ